LEVKEVVRPEVVELVVCFRVLSIRRTPRLVKAAWVVDGVVGVHVLDLVVDYFAGQDGSDARASDAV
jgi:hypothetical protein